MKYRVFLSTGASMAIDVEADSPEHARVKAEEEAYVSLCHQCGGDVTVGDEWEAEAVYESESDREVWTPSETSA